MAGSDSTREGCREKNRMPPGIHVSVGASHSSEPASGGATGSCTPRAWFPGLWSRLLGEEGLCGEQCSADGPTPLVLPAGHLPLRLWPSCITRCHTGPRSLPCQTRLGHSVRLLCHSPALLFSPPLAGSTHLSTKSPGYRPAASPLHFLQR